MNVTGRPHLLEQAVPDFLNRLDSDPQEAWKEFHDFTWKLLLSYPPPVFRDLPPEVRDDITSQIILKCVEDDFQLLRKYEDRGVPFAAWVARIARNRAIDDTRAARTPRTGPDIPRCSHPDEDFHAAELLQAVRECMLQLRDKCRLLLKAGAEGYMPREIAALLGLPDMDGKKISDSLRACRRMLKQMLIERGFEFAPSRRRRSHEPA